MRDLLSRKVWECDASSRRFECARVLNPVRLRFALRSQAKAGAGDEARTRDVHLGKVVLYQLSYTRFLGGLIMSRHSKDATFNYAGRGENR